VRAQAIVRVLSGVPRGPCSGRCESAATTSSPARPALSTGLVRSRGGVAGRCGFARAMYWSLQGSYYEYARAGLLHGSGLRP